MRKITGGGYFFTLPGMTGRFSEVFGEAFFKKLQKNGRLFDQKAAPGNFWMTISTFHKQRFHIQKSSAPFPKEEPERHPQKNRQQAMPIAGFQSPDPDRMIRARSLVPYDQRQLRTSGRSCPYCAT
ncbi:hypothetical protein [Gluconacetobacter entanii]|uniref:hypothetical protein n=1 Tax=Gluconacetobacter entanii TaxID=108528 RepID=UPI0011B58CE8|nr:hypothetical protein [Gluconacetobacter entanii]MCE2579429.1 hypothetical protein [Komagataeibacter sp. FNDCR1]